MNYLSAQIEFSSISLFNSKESLISGQFTWLQHVFNELLESEIQKTGQVKFITFEFLENEAQVYISIEEKVRLFNINYYIINMM